MSSTPYEPLAQEGGEDVELLEASSSQRRTARSRSPALPAVRPPTYYGNGPFDPPSSDDEDDLTVYEKNVPLTPGAAERAEGLSWEGGLRVGGTPKVNSFATLHAVPFTELTLFRHVLLR